jgi:hypothetical protein
MEQPKLGSFASAMSKRDAIHIAILPAILRHDMYGGDDVEIKIINGEICAMGTSDTNNKPQGIVDPWLFRNGNSLPAGTRAFILLDPGTITSLRHEWTHPGIPNAPPADKLASMLTIGRLAEKLGGFSAEDVIHQAEKAIRKGDDYVCMGNDLSNWLDNQEVDEFWEHFTAITGQARPAGMNGFTCAC